MDPLTALGLSANIAQFVGYAIKLFTTSNEIYKSRKGCTEKIALLDEVYGELHDINSRLQSSTQGNSQSDSQGLDSEDLKLQARYADTINRLSRACKEDCNNLLGAAAKLKGKDGHHSRWNSFRAALQTIWKGDKIAELEQRLHDTQSTLTLNLSALTSEWQCIFRQRLDKLRADNKKIGVQLSDKLITIEKAIKDLNKCSTIPDPRQQTASITPADISALEKKMSTLSMTSLDTTKEHMILSSLNFDSRVSRYTSIPDAYGQTFNWVFQKGTCQDANIKSTRGSVFRWLEHGDGFFWISGKPGSGKSTLMKFIVGHEETLPALLVWSQAQPVVVASHFFWSAGTPIQKSRQGLLKTLLFDIFRQQPDLIKVLCPERWLRSLEALSQEPWHTPELARVTERIARCENLSAKFCFFIDGLDEFEGDHTEFCQALGKLSTSTHVKLCVSSRPWNVFEDSFGRDVSTKLYIHEVTRGDIYKYTKGKLEEHPRWNDLGVEVDNASLLIDQVTQRAAGVFLWIYLVVKQLRDGLSEHDSFDDLQKRLEAIPSDLEAFFKQILESVDPFYHEKMARMLQVAISTRAPAPTAIYGFLDIEYDNADYVFELPTKSLGSEKEILHHKTVCHRLNARSRGLLEVNGNCVEFLHRTVMDFLRTREMCHFLEAKIIHSFDPELALLRAFIAYIKTLGMGDRRFWEKLRDFCREAIYFAQHVRNTRAYKLLEHLDVCMMEMHRNYSITLVIWDDKFLLRKSILEASFIEYFDYILPRIPTYLSEFSGENAISTVLDFFDQSQDPEDRYRYKSMLECLLEHGQNPNERYLSSTYILLSSWERLIMKSNSPIFSDYLQYGLYSLMLKYGANPNQIIPNVYADLGTVPWVHLSYYFYNSDFATVESSKIMLQLLDDFKQACATKLQHPQEEKMLQIASTEPRIILFGFIRVISTNNCIAAAEIMDSLLYLAKMHQHDISQYFPAIEGKFPPSASTQLRAKYLGENQDISIISPNIEGPPRMNQKRKQPQQDEFRRKRQRSI